MNLVPNADSATREVFVNIAPWMRLIFYGMMASSLGVLGLQLWRRARLWGQGQPNGFERDWRLWLHRVVVYGLAQKKVHRKSLGAALHVLLFSGFVVLTIGTTLLMIADQGPVNFHHGWYYLVYELGMDVFGVILCVGCGLAFSRRMFFRVPTLGHNARDWVLLGSLLALCITGFLVEALRLHFTQGSPDIARWSVIGHAIDMMLLRDIDVATAQHLHLGFWWLHAILVSLFIVSIPVTRFMHVLTGPINIAVRPDRPMGALKALKIEEVEKTGKVGVTTIADFTQQQLLSLDACMECGRCEEACPASASGKPLSPKKLVLNLRDAMANAASSGNLHGDVISAETLWACTMCQACVQECPVMIGQVDLISDLRRNLVGEGQIAGSPAKAMAGINRQSNPYGRPASERMGWAVGLDVPTVDSNPGFEYLLWLGCAVAFDPRAQKVARALTQLLTEAKVNFAVLGEKERCTGDPARRLGDEFLFQEMAQANVETLSLRQVKKIVTPCPHCLNSLQNEYVQFGGGYQVQHHSQLLAELVNTGKLVGTGKPGGKVTYHDPCYLARANSETVAPRKVLEAATGCAVSEMPRHGTKTFCCGAGGGRMWVDEAPAQRVSKIRAEEATATGAQTVATSCPFCLNMLGDAVAAKAGDREVRVLDIAEILLENLARARTEARESGS